MKTTVLWTLVVINAVLLASFVSRFGDRPGFSGTAVAQPARQPARPGDYLMIPGEVTGATNGIVYVVDTTNGMLSALTYNVSRKRLENMQSIDLTPIFQQRVQPEQPGRGGER